MNAHGRKQLSAISDLISTTVESLRQLAERAAEEGADLSALQAEAAALEPVVLDISARIEEQQCDEQDKFDNMPEGLQASERGQAMEEIAEELSTAQEQAAEADEIMGGDADTLDDFEALVTEVADRLEEAAESIDNAVSR